MALRITMDIADSFIDQAAQTVIDGLSRGRQQAELTNVNAFVAPNSLGITLQPINATAAWAAATGKWAAANFTLPATGWEVVPHRGAADWFLASKGLPAAGSIPTKAILPVNAGLFLEFFCYTPAHTRVVDVVTLKFGLYYTLHIHSDGTADLATTAPGADSPYLVKGAALSAGAGDLAGKFVTVTILPWRRGRILVVSNQGGYFEAYAGARLDTGKTLAANKTSGESGYWVTTEAAQAYLTPTPLARAFLTLNPLRYPLAGSSTPPIVPLADSVSTPPDTLYLENEAQDLTGATLSVSDGSGNTFSPTGTKRLSQIQYKIAMTAPDGGSGYSLVTPQIFGAHIEFDVQLSTRTYNTNVLSRVLEASINLSRDRGSKSFEFTLDNPVITIDGGTYEAYTALKDLWNRAFVAEFTPEGADGEYSIIFAGQTDPAKFVGGTASRITVPCTGRRKRLRSFLLSDSRSYDGWEHGDAVYQILHDAGVADSDIVVVHDGVALDSADQGEDPLWRPANGISADDFIDHLAQTFSGWVFDDIGGTYYYAPKEYFTDAVLSAIGVPEIFLTTPLDDLTHRPTLAARGPNATVLVAMSDGQESEEPRANDIWILGQDPNSGDVLGAHYVDEDSIRNDQAPNYVGERRIFIYSSASITTVSMATRALGVIADRLTTPVRRVPFTLPDYQQALPIEGPVYIHNYGYGLISDVQGSWDNDRYRLTTYTAELL